MVYIQSEIKSVKNGSLFVNGYFYIYSFSDRDDRVPIFVSFIFKDWNFFLKNNVKFVRGIPFFGANYKTFLGSTTLLDGFCEIYQRYPNERFVGMYRFGGKPFYFIRDPELVKQITMKDADHFMNHLIHVEEGSHPLLNRSLFTMNNQRWKDMRATLSPAFTGSKLRAMSSLLVEVSNTFCKELKKEVKDQVVEYDMKELFGRLANDAIASCAFGMQLNSMVERNNEFYKTGFNISQFGLKFFFYALIPKIMNGFRVRVFDEKSTKYFRQIVLDNMKYRETHNIVRPDMINILLETKKGLIESKETENENESFSAVEDVKTSTNISFKKWEDDDLIAQSITFFLAVFSTISVTLGFVAHELAVNPDVQQKLYQEIQQFRKELNGQPATYEIIQNMKYMDMVLSEVLRRWIGFIINRVVTKLYVLENTDGTKLRLNVGDAVSDFKLEKSPRTMDPVILCKTLPEPRDGFWLNIRGRN